MFDKHYVGLDITGLENNGKLRPISRVTLLADNENAYTAGDDTGMELVSDCPHATQEIVEAILAQVRGYQYQMYRADDAGIDPAAELGDGVTVGGMYSVLSRIDDDGSGFPSISAPGESELEDEYPSAGPMAQEFNRKLAQVRSSITKTAEEIILKVEATDGRVSSLSTTVDGLSSTVKGYDSRISSIDQKVDSITLSVSNGKTSSSISLLVDGVVVSSKTIRFTGDVVFESSLSSGQTIVSGDCIQTGHIKTDYIHLGGEIGIYSDSDPDIGSWGGSFGYYTGATVDNAGNVEQTSGVGIMYSEYRGKLVCTNAGVWTGYGSTSGLSAYKNGVTIKGTNITINGTLKDSSGAVITSDLRTKTEIDYDMTKMLEILDLVNPCTYRRKDGKRRHTGLVAQEVEMARDAVGVDSNDFAALCIDTDGNYGVRYTEFVPILIAGFHELSGRLKKLEETR